MPPSFGFFQLDNLRRSQAKFIMVVLSDKVYADSSLLPQHPLLKPDLLTDVASAPAKIQSQIIAAQYPAWWPVVLVSEDGVPDGEVERALAAQGLINVYSYSGGWSALLRESN